MAAAPMPELHENAKDFLAMLNTNNARLAAPSVEEPHPITLSSSSSSSSSSYSVKLIEGNTGVNEEQQQQPANNTKEGGGADHMLTVFYAGKVYAYQNIPPLQIGAMLTVAQRLSEAAASSPPLPPPSARYEGTSINPSEGAADLLQKDPVTPHKAPVQRIEQLPISRKASLARFFAIRNERLKSLGLTEKGSRPVLFSEAKRNSEDIADAGSGCIEPSVKPKKQCVGKANP